MHAMLASHCRRGRSPRTGGAWLALALLLLTLPAVTQAQGAAVAPYLGQDLVNPPRRMIYNLLKSADLIFMGSLAHPPVERLRGDGKGIDSFTGIVDVQEVLYGRPRANRVTLTWKATTLNIGGGSHLFFVVYTNQGPQVLHEMYLYSGSADLMRTYVGLEGSKSLSLQVIKALLHPERDRQQLGELLLAEARHTHPQRAATAVLLATELTHPTASKALRHVVEQHGPYYEDAAWSLLRVDGGAGLEAVLQSLANLPPDQAAVQPRIFSVIALQADPFNAPRLAQYAGAHPSSLVSCAFALARLGGPECRRILQQWANDPALAAIQVNITQGEETQSFTQSQLCLRALQLLDQQAREKDAARR